MAKKAKKAKKAKSAVKKTAKKTRKVAKKKKKISLRENCRPLDAGTSRERSGRFASRSKFLKKALVDERGCRRDIRSNGWIAFSKGSLSKTGPAEETSFLRSVRILRSAISPAIVA